MLAERKTRVKWTLNPRGNLWSQDTNKFGQKMLEKMGWTAGKGLGANEQGIIEHVKVSYKSDNKCIGYKELGNEWIQQQSQFEDFLSELNTSHYKETSIEDEKGNDSLEQKSRESKARLHYKKFTRGKDLSNYSKQDLACILGVKKTKDEINVKVSDNNDEPSVGQVDDSFGITTIHSGSISEYFNKMKNKLNSQTEAFDEVSSSNVEVESLDKLKKKKQVTFAESDQVHQIPEGHSNEPINGIKTKSKKKDKLDGSCHSDNDKLANKTSGKYAELYNGDEIECSSEFANTNNDKEIFNSKKRKISEEESLENSESGDNSEAIMDKNKKKKKKLSNNDEEISNTDKSVRINGSTDESNTNNEEEMFYSKKRKNISEKEKNSESDAIMDKKKKKKTNNSDEEISNNDKSVRINDSTAESGTGVHGEKKKHKKNSNEECDISEEYGKSDEQLENIENENFKEVSVGTGKRKEKKKSNNINELVEGDSKQVEILICDSLVEVSEVLMDTKKRKKHKKSNKNTNEGDGKQDETVMTNGLVQVSEEEKANITVQKKKHKKKFSSSEVLSVASNNEECASSEAQCLERFENEDDKEIKVESKKKKKKKSHNITDEEIGVEQINPKQDESVINNEVIQIAELENEAVEAPLEKKRKKKSNSSVSIEPEKNSIEECRNYLEVNKEELSCPKSVENSKKNKKQNKKDKLAVNVDIESIKESKKKEGSSNVESSENENVDESNLNTKKKKRKRSCDITEEQTLESTENLDCRTDFETQKKKKKRSHDTNGEFIKSPEEPSSVNIVAVSAIDPNHISIKNMKSSVFRKLVTPFVKTINFNGSNIHEIMGYRIDELYQGSQDGTDIEAYHGLTSK